MNLIIIINNLYCAFSAGIQRRFTRDSKLLKLENDSVKSLSTEGLEVNFKALVHKPKKSIQEIT